MMAPLQTAENDVYQAKACHISFDIDERSGKPLGIRDESDRFRHACGNAILASTSGSGAGREEKGELGSPLSPVSEKHTHERPFQLSNARFGQRPGRPGWLGGDEQPGVQHA